MSNFAKIVFVVAIAATLVLCQRSNADLKLLTIRAPEGCPEGLTIKGKNDSGGMMVVDVDVDAELIANAGELYKGQVRAQAFLKVATSDQQLAFAKVDGTTDGKRTRFQFRISPSVAKTSELQLGVHLYEKNGRPTLGGGVSMQVHLAGFEPKTAEKTKSN